MEEPDPVNVVEYVEPKRYTRPEKAYVPAANVPSWLVEV